MTEPTSPSFPTNLAAGKKVPSASSKPQLTPQDWIDAAIQLLVSQSIEAVRVDVLAKAMGVTRGSFYWHFKDRNDLLKRLLRNWREAATDQVIERLNKSHLGPRQRLQELLALPQRGTRATDSADIELAIRTWARHDDLARQAVEVVDAQRLSYVTHCLSDAGIPKEAARHQAFVLYSYLICESLLRDQSDPQGPQQRLQFVERLLIPAAHP